MMMLVLPFVESEFGSFGWVTRIGVGDTTPTIAAAATTWMLLLAAPPTNGMNQAGTACVMVTRSTVTGSSTDRDAGSSPTVPGLGLSTTIESAPTAKSVLSRIRARRNRVHGGTGVAVTGACRKGIASCVCPVEHTKNAGLGGRIRGRLSHLTMHIHLSHVKSQPNGAKQENAHHQQGKNYGLSPFVLSHMLT